MSLIVQKTKETIGKLSEHGIGFYTSGQLFLEEYYTLAVIGKAGLSTLHMDGNTRLCTATAAASMRESFGSDGQPGSYTDIDVTDCILMVGHNMASTQTVLWSRILDRLNTNLPNLPPPNIIVIDPRPTYTTAKSTIHLSPHVGTNVALLNGILHLIFHHKLEDTDFISNHTIGIDKLQEVVKSYTPEHVEEITGVKADTLRKAVEIIGKSKGLLSTVLQGVYQSNQATAAACQVNNVNLVLGRIGKPGCGIFQMNGQPTAQNNREAGCNASHWNIPLSRLPHWQEPTHIMQMLNHIAKSTILMFWISGTNPLVTLPNLPRIRSLLCKEDLFVVVQDIYMTETTEQAADVVLPALQWGEKTGCFTNVDRTVHLSHKAVDGPEGGEARSDLDIWVDYATRMDFKDQNGELLVHWKTPEEAFEAWKKTTKGRPCDYTGLSYAKLTGGSGIQWPCNEKYPNGRERFFEDGRFFTAHDECESYGHDLETGCTLTPEEYKILNPDGRAILKSCHYLPPLEATSSEYPLQLMTGRNVYQFHSRTKTARTPQLRKACPESYVEIHRNDAEKEGIEDGEMVCVESRTGKVVVKAQVTDKGDQGRVFVPMHFGDMIKDKERKEGRKAANELTLDNWDFISKQPTFKSGAVRITKLPSSPPATPPSKTPEQEQEQASSPATSSQPRKTTRHRQLDFWLGATSSSLSAIAKISETLTSRYHTQFEFTAGIALHNRKIIDILSSLDPFFKKYGTNTRSGNAISHHLSQALFHSPLAHADKHAHVSESYDFLADLHNLYTYVAHISACFVALKPVAGALWDDGFVEAVQKASKEVDKVDAWVKMVMTVNAAQTLVVPASVEVQDQDSEDEDEDEDVAEDGKGGDNGDGKVV